jgi:predicted HTH transcriptional regulator
VSLSIEVHEVDGSLVLSIDVPEGAAKPYFMLTRKIVLVRRGANNVVADPDRDLPSLAAGKNFPAPPWGH